MGMRLSVGGNSVKAMLTRLDKRKAVELQFSPSSNLRPGFLFRYLGSRMAITFYVDHKAWMWAGLGMMRLLMERRRIPKKTYEWAVAVAVEDML